LKTSTLWALALAGALVPAARGDAAAPPAGERSQRDSLVGAWRSQVRFSGGALVDMKDLESLIAFNAGGTMTESSNYDGAPPVPPAYGVWSKGAPHRFEAKYVFHVTKPPVSLEEVTKGGGWMPNGHGELTEKVTLSDDGASYKSTITYAVFDQAGKPVEGGGEGSATGARVGF
jgi:hypothetical protein